ncbi:MAG: hypothetical protein KGL95_05560 [Patescibacteria group bacterium]|nr:hypothetical protein [Patescibacteria group bacterium]
MVSEQEIPQIHTLETDIDNTNAKTKKKLSKRNLFFSTMRTLEGESKLPIKKIILLKELEKTSRFTMDEAEEWITKMHRESAIYEPKIDYYNLV